MRFTANILGKGIVHLLFATPDEMAQTLLRFQEFYESPVFKGRYFTREEFLAWYAESKNGADYSKDWGPYGFNFPSESLKPFYEGKFLPHTEAENELLEYFTNQKENNFYIIATSTYSPLEMMGHEIAHALYYLYPEYRQLVQAVLAKVDLTPLKTFLKTHPEYGNYHDAVLDDEVHAYLSQTTQELAEQGFNLVPYKEVIPALQELYIRFVQEGGVRG